MKRYFNAVVALAVVLSCFVSTAYAIDPNTVLNRIKESGKLRLPVMASEEPQYIKDPRTGQWSGFWVDFGQDIADVLGVKIEYYETSWGNVAADFQAGKVDLVIGLNPNPRRAMVVDYVPEVIVEGIWSVIAREGFEAKTWKEMNVPEVRIAVQKGSTMQNIAERELPNATVVIVGSRDQAILELQSNKIDAIILGDQDAAALHSKGIGKAFAPAPYLRTPTYIGIRREEGNEGFSNFLAMWISEQKALNRPCKHIGQYLLQKGIDMSVLPQSGKTC